MKQARYTYSVQYEDGFVWTYESTKNAHYGTARIYGEEHNHGRIMRIW